MHTTARVELTSENLLDVIGQMSHNEFEQFFHKIIRIRSQNLALTLTEPEEELVKRIYSFSLPAEEHQRLLELAQKAEAEELTDEAAWEEYGELAERSEILNAQRIEAAIELSALRDQPLETTLRQLGFQSRGA